jgi:hypothetical protein
MRLGVPLSPSLTSRTRSSRSGFTSPEKFGDSARHNLSNPISPNGPWRLALAPHCG